MITHRATLLRDLQLIVRANKIQHSQDILSSNLLLHLWSIQLIVLSLCD